MSILVNLIKNLIFTPLNSYCLQKNSIALTEVLIVLTLLVNYSYLIYLMAAIFIRYFILNSRILSYVLLKTKFFILIKLFLNAVDNLLNSITFLPTYYLRSYNIWQDGLLFDFLQKKSSDLWVRKFVIYTGFLFSERIFLTSVISLYIDNLIKPLREYSYTELRSISNILNTILYLYLLLFFIIITPFVLL